jgi:cell division protein FtsQ
MGLERGASIFSVPARRHERAIARNPWVESVLVRRQFPDRLIVDVTERSARAIVSLGELSYVDRDGVVFKKVARGDKLDFPVITGLRRGDPATTEGRRLLARALELQSLLERDPRFGPSKISEIHVSRETGLSVITTGDAMEIRFGPDNFPVKLEGLARLLPALEREGVRARMIDLGFRNMAVVKPRGDAPDGNTVGL